MLRLKNITKTYRVGNIETKALRNISLTFRKQEFVAILGTSGSGKTTALNIIGGLDRYDSGDLIIKGKNTSNFKDKEWDAYRNNSIGFVFQSYNLINHLSIVANVEMGMTLSGVSRKVKNKKAVEVLKKVGLEEHLHKKPNQLSGGQQQRVAIARALANDPEILLCDEPTGALDSETSVQIMDLIKEIASDRLVIMVTHNPDIANKYANRIIEFKDGEVVADSNPYSDEDERDQFDLRHTSMSFFTALNLSFKNIMTKKGRTFLTSFASSIGIIGIAVILSLSTGFQAQIDEFQRDALSEFPIIISQTAMSMDEDAMRARTEEVSSERVDSKELTLYNPEETTMVHKNNLSEEFLEYLDKVNPEYASSAGYTYATNLNLLKKTEEGYRSVSFKGTSSGMPLRDSTQISTYPIEIVDPNATSDSKNMLEKNYELLAGSYPSSKYDVVLVTDSRNRINQETLIAMGYDVKNMETISFDDILAQELLWIPNNLYYKETQFGTFVPETDFSQLTKDSGKQLNIVGIIRLKEDSQISLLSEGFIYSDELTQEIISESLSSDIVKKQIAEDYNVLTRLPISEEEKETILSYLGGSEKPLAITLYPRSFESKELLVEYLDAFNVNKKQEEVIVYTDLAKTLSSLTKGIMDGITVVLIAFAAISLVVSLIMIGIITYTSVIERTKEIGILKALGARKKDISRVFDAETFILGVFSGTLGVLIAYALTFPINSIIYKMTTLTNVAHLRIEHAVFLIVISTSLTMLGGHIPAKMASKKDPVEALRSE